MVFVKRNDSGKVIGFTSHVDEAGGHVEELPRDHIDVLTYLNPPPSVDDFRLAVESYVERVALARGFKNASHAAWHANSTHPPWRADGEAFIAWSDQVWLYVFAEFERVQTGKREQPTVEDFIEELPSPPWKIGEDI